jgi:hypothetical protein
MLMEAAAFALRRKGLRYLIRSLITYVVIEKCYDFLMGRKGSFLDAQFVVGSKTYNYFSHRYERTVELPIAFEFIKTGKNVLEVGNVLNHYPLRLRDRDIVDKYEKEEGVINTDILEFKPNCKYDRIVSISTIEHIGYDELGIPDPNKPMETINHMKTLMAENGSMLVTMPIGYNSVIDKMVFGENTPFEQQYYLKRVSKDNHWKQVSFEVARECKYDKPYRCANAIIVGIITHNTIAF